MNNKHFMSKVTKTSSWITDGLSQKDIDEARKEVRKQIEEEICKYNVGNHVCLLGSKSNPYPYIKFADMMVHTSHVESQGLTILEAMALKTPCVAVASLGPKDFMNGKAGILVEANIKSILEGVIKLLLQQYDIKIISNAYEMIKDRFSPDITIDLFEELIRK